jgi:hypothetical protein
MQWMWLTAAAIVGIVAGYLAGWRVAFIAMRPTLQELNRNLASDRNLALRVLRRELANWMFRHDPDCYLKTYKIAHEATKAISTLDRSHQSVELSKLTDKHKFYTDFDLIATRDYVLYADALGINTYEEVEQHYAIRDFRVHQASTREPAMIYESPLFTVRPVSHFADVRYGVHFKDTDEYGLYTIFLDDSGEKTYEFVFRSDDTFQKEIVLEPLSIATGDA